MSHRALAWFALAAVVFQLAVWNARVGNSDTYYQLVATVHLVDTGSLGFTARELRAADAAHERGNQFARGTDGRWHQVHDPGNKVLMTPGVVLASLLGHQPDGRHAPTAATKVLAAACLALFATLLPLLLLLALGEVLSPRRALRWAALGLVATLLLPYSKQTWDVYPCAVLTAGVAWAALRRLRRGPGSGDTVAMFALAGGAAWFRTSFAPFLLLGCVATEVVASRRGAVADPRRAIGRVAAGLATWVVVCVPLLVVHARVTGNPVRPPVSLHPGNAALDRSPLVGAAGLLGSPNRGLLVFAPVLALGVAWRWRDLPGVVRRFVLAWAVPIVGYVLAVGSVAAWGRFGWGPRYLVPMVPLLWIPTAVVATRLMDRGGAARRVVVVLVGLSAGIAAVGTLAAWDAVAATGDGVIAEDTWYPKQIVETARVTGGTVSLEDDQGLDAGIDARRWPDLALLHAARKVSVPDAVGYLGFVLVLAVVACAYRRAEQAVPSRVVPTEPGGDRGRAVTAPILGG